MSQRRWAVAVTGLLSLGLIVWVVASRSRTPTGPPEITIVSPSGVSVTPFYYALEHQLFEHAGLNVRPLIRPGAKETIQIFSSGGAEVMLAGPGPMGLLIARGVPARVLGFFAYGHVALVVFDPLIKTVQDLKGKRVGISGTGSGSEVIARIVLLELGFDLHKDAQVRPMTAAEMVKAGSQKEIDAAVTWPPFAQGMTLEIPNARLLLDLNAQWQQQFKTELPAVWHGLLVKDQLLKDDPASVKKIEAILRESVAKVRSDPEEQVRLLVKYERIEESWARAAVNSKMVIFSEHPLTLTADDRQDAMRIWDYMYKFGYLDQPATPETMFWEWK